MPAAAITVEDFKAMLAAYRSAVEAQTRAKYAFAFVPELEKVVSAPLLARAESRVTAAEIEVVNLFKRVGVTS
jgi:hypothetical protein